MPQRSDAPGAHFPDDPKRREELGGGADAVEKTTYVIGQGTEPEAQHHAGATGPVSESGGGPRAMLFVVALVVGGGLVYLLAIR